MGAARECQHPGPTLALSCQLQENLPNYYRLVIIDSCRPSCADPPTAVLPSAEFCTVLSDGGLHPRRLGCIEHDLQSCLYRPWGVKTELSHKLLHKVSALRMSICGAVQIATHRWTLFSLQLAKRHSSLSLTHSIEAA